MTTNLLPGQEARFAILFPMLVKQKHKDSGIGQKNLVKAASVASAQEINNFLSLSLSTLDRLKMIYSLAKSEIRTISVESSYIQSLMERVNSVLESNNEFFSDEELFPICLLISVSIQINEPMHAC
jgi:hypothetical protein